MENYETIWEISRFSFDLLTIVAGYFVVTIGFKAVLAPILCYIFLKEEREKDDIPSIIRGILLLGLVIFIFCGSLVDGTTYVSREYYNQNYYIDEGIVESVELVKAEGFSVKFNGQEYELIQRFASIRLNIENCYVRIYYVLDSSEDDGTNANRYIAKIECLTESSAEKQE